MTLRLTPQQLAQLYRYYLQSSVFESLSREAIIGYAHKMAITSYAVKKHFQSIESGQRKIPDYVKEQFQKGEPLKFPNNRETKRLEELAQAPPDNIAVARIIEGYARQNNMSQRAIADLAHVSYSVITHYTHGSYFPSSESLSRLAGLPNLPEPDRKVLLAYISQIQAKKEAAKKGHPKKEKEASKKDTKNIPDVPGPREAQRLAHIATLPGENQWIANAIHGYMADNDLGIHELSKKSEISVKYISSMHYGNMIPSKKIAWRLARLPNWDDSVRDRLLDYAGEMQNIDAQAHPEPANARQKTGAQQTSLVERISRIPILGYDIEGIKFAGTTIAYKLKEEASGENEEGNQGLDPELAAADLKEHTIKALVSSGFAKYYDPSFSLEDIVTVTLIGKKGHLYYVDTGLPSKAYNEFRGFYRVLKRALASQSKKANHAIRNETRADAK